MTDKLLILIICIIGLLIISPIHAQVVTAKVDDKGIFWDNQIGIVGTLHTCYGEITVRDEDYNSIGINDTIKYNTDMISFFWGEHYWDVEKVN